jgi:hypothetical protein
MGILKDRCEKFLEELKSSVTEMDQLTEKIKATDPWDETFDAMYERELMLAVKTVGIFEDLHINLQRLDEEDPSFRFFTNRVRKEADSLVQFGYIELGGGDVH